MKTKTFPPELFESIKKEIIDSLRISTINRDWVHVTVTFSLPSMERNSNVSYSAEHRWQYPAMTLMAPKQIVAAFREIYKSMFQNATSLQDIKQNWIPTKLQVVTDENYVFDIYRSMVSRTASIMLHRLFMLEELYYKEQVDFKAWLYELMKFNDSVIDMVDVPDYWD
jgi:hypothetical protein